MDRTLEVENTNIIPGELPPCRLCIRKEPFVCISKKPMNLRKHLKTTNWMKQEVAMRISTGRYS